MELRRAWFPSEQQPETKKDTVIPTEEKENVKQIPKCLGSEILPIAGVRQANDFHCFQSVSQISWLTYTDQGARLLFSALSSFSCACCFIVIRRLFYLHHCLQDPGRNKKIRGRGTCSSWICSLFKEFCLRSFIQQLQLIPHRPALFPVPYSIY